MLVSSVNFYIWLSLTTCIKQKWWCGWWRWTTVWL